MKTKFLTLALLSIVSITSVFAQDRTTVTANNSEISDNLDLRAVASIFGDSKDLEDFERRLNNSGSRNWELSFFSQNTDELKALGKKIIDYAYNLPTSETNIQFVKAQAFSKCIEKGTI